MTDPIKEQAEKEARKISHKILYDYLFDGEQVSEDMSGEVARYIFYPIETHLRDKSEIEKARKRACNDAAILASENDTLENRIKALEAEVERLKTNHAKSRLALEHKKNEIHAHNLELTQAVERAKQLEPLWTYLDNTKEEHYDEARALDKLKVDIRRVLSSPASRKYLAMIAVVEAAKEWGKNKDSHKESQIKLCDAIVNIEALESEEA